MEILKKLRKQNNYTQLEVAKLLGIQQKRYSTYETGATEPNIDMLKNFSKLYNVSIDYIVGNETKGKTIYSEQQKSTITDLCELNDDYLELASKYIKNLLADQVELEKRRKNLIN